MEASKPARLRTGGRRGWLINSGLIVVVLLLLIVAVVGLRKDPAGEAARSLRTVAVAKGQVVQSVSASGSVVSAASASVNFATSGTLNTLGVRPGDRVNAGQQLATLDQTQAARQLNAANAQLAVAQQALDNAQSRGADTTQARSQVAQAEVQVGSAQQTLDQGVLTSPVTGTVTAVNGQVGDRVSAGSTSRSAAENAGASAGSSDSSATSSGSAGGSSGGTGSSGGAGSSGGGSSSGGGGSPAGSSGSSGGSGSSSGGDALRQGGGQSASNSLITIYDLDHLQVRAEFAEIDAAKLRTGQDATVTVNALPDETVNAHVVAIDPVSNSSGGVVQYGVTLNLDAAVPGLKPGQSGSVRVDVNHADQALYLPAAAVQGSGPEATVVVLQGTQQVRRTVRVGIRGDQTTQILSGLSEGDQIVIPAANPSTSQPVGRGPFGRSSQGGSGQ